MSGGRSQHEYWFAAGASLLVHAGLGLLIARLPLESMGGTSTFPTSSSGLNAQLDWAESYVPPPIEPPTHRTPKPPLVLLPPEPPQPEAPAAKDQESELILGISESKNQTENWIGFKDPTPHEARLSEVEQPSLDPNPGSFVSTGSVGGGGGASGEGGGQIGGSPVEATLPKEEVVSRTVLPPPVPAPAQDHPQPQPKQDEQTKQDPQPEAKEIKKQEPARVSAADPHEPGEDPKPAEKTLEERAAQEPKPERKERAEVSKQIESPQLPPPLFTEPIQSPTPPAESTRPTRQSQLSNPAPVPESTPSDGGHEKVGQDNAPAQEGTQAAGPAGNPGLQDERESDATSLTQPLRIAPGKPAAAEGLDIITRRPQFTRLTRVTAVPANPLVRITFNRTGRVGKVELLQSSGTTDVDGPVINAVYQWTAKGKKIEALAMQPPGSGLALTVRIILN